VIVSVTPPPEMSGPRPHRVVTTSGVKRIVAGSRGHARAVTRTTPVSAAVAVARNRSARRVGGQTDALTPAETPVTTAAPMRRHAAIG